MGFRKPIFDAVKAARGKPFTPAEVWQFDRALDALDVPKGPKPGAEPAAAVKGGRGALAALIGGTAASLLFVSIPEDEGLKFRAYRDIVGVWTICNGDTKNVRPGMVETKEGCERRLEQQLIAHAAPVMKCTPRLKEAGRDYQRAAAVSLAYNVGTGAYCKSSVDRHFDAGNWRAGCDALLKWNKAGGEEVRGLTLRRQRERAICLRGL